MNPRYRWTICALIFAATTINYVDRIVLNLLAPTLEREIGWSKWEYGCINAAFQAAYAIGMVGIGHLIDRWGTRTCYAATMVAWSLAAMAHAAARSALGFGAARFALGLGEAGNFPAAIKTVAEWFPQRERALATGIFNSGTNVGAIVTPLIVPSLTRRFGWRGAFLSTGALGFVWLAFWLKLYRKPPAIEGEPAPQPSMKWSRLFPVRQTWAFAAGKFLTDPVWWFYISWLPKYLYDTYGLDLKDFGPPLVIVYVAADLGSVAGGWLSSWLIRRGHTVNVARKRTMLVCAFCVTPLLLVSQISNLPLAVGLISLAAAAHQAWSANLFTLTSDTFPTEAVGSVVGIGGMAGAIGGVLFQLLVGGLKSYTIPFVVASVAYLVALGVIHRLSPTLARAELTP